MSRAFFREPVRYGPVLGGLMLAACAMSGLAEPARSAATANASVSSPMKFTLLMEGPAESCGTKCRPLVSAAGMITADTPHQFQSFVHDNLTKSAVPGATVVLESDGGSVLGALDLGRAIRRAGLATTVGRVVEHRNNNGSPYGEVLTHADCQSMCPFVLLAGVQRAVPPDARVLVHQIWLGDRREDAAAASYSAEDLMVVQRDIGSIVQYTAEMGGDAELVALSLRVPPWEPMRVLSRDELRRTHLDLAPGSGEALVAAATVQTAAGPAPSDEESERLANGRGWMTISRDGQVTLARSHPLTIEGDQIGSFDLYLACGTAPQTFTLTYRETRTGSSDRSLPRNLTQVTLLIEDQVQPLKIGTSDRQTRRGQVESVASVVLPARLVRMLAGNGPASMTVETESNGNPRTVIRIGNAGFEHSFSDLERACPLSRDTRTAKETRPQ